MGIGLPGCKSELRVDSLGDLRVVGAAEHCPVVFSIYVWHGQAVVVEQLCQLEWAVRSSHELVMAGRCSQFLHRDGHMAWQQWHASPGAQNFSNRGWFLTCLVAA